MTIEAPNPASTYVIFTASKYGWLAYEDFARTKVEAADILADAIEPQRFIAPTDFCVHCGGRDVTPKIVAIILRNMVDNHGEDAAFEMLEDDIGDPLSEYVAAYDNGRADGQDMWDNYNALLRLGKAADLGAMDAI